VTSFRRYVVQEICAALIVSRSCSAASPASKTRHRWPLPGFTSPPEPLIRSLSNTTSISDSGETKPPGWG
jgi:hypothetical protein